MSDTREAAWPDLPTAAWRDTYATLHLWTQIIGKIRLSRSPWLNHSWHVTLYVTTRGLATSPIPNGERHFEIEFDFIDHVLRMSTSDGVRRLLPLAGQSVASFYTLIIAALAELSVHVKIDEMPNELPAPIRFSHDNAHASYDHDAVRRFFRILSSTDRVFKQFRTGFLGKASPVHFFWGSFDLAVTRFSGRLAPPLTAPAPNVAAWVMREAYSHEVSSCGFWPGNGGYGRAAFYVYAYPEPPGYGDTRLRTPGAFYDGGLGQFILPYDAVRRSQDPDTLLLGFLQETYETAADKAGWDRQALERKALERPA